MAVLRFAEHVIRDVEACLIDKVVPRLCVVEKVPGSCFFENAECSRNAKATAFSHSRRFPLVDQNPVSPKLRSKRDGLHFPLVKRFG